MLDMIVSQMLLPNLMVDAHGHPQVGDAQASASAVQEMLAQSHDGEIVLLPALPARWKSGMARGLRLRGGHSLGLVWADGRLTKAELAAGTDEERVVRAGERTFRLELKQGRTYNLLEFL